ncbi:DNA cytosine methyltransferase [Desulfovibrio fairfieldensis]|uniref:DNA (cytosine-5-)-methyltransferase n=1 Tax=Desulfovibrio fairfieldensis TaxID=44742 RepID=A0A0X8JK57_9BACT|nr:DNA cytosine methyltransferase [Desulfovibrio fairfieldensis]AMD90087.1 hypothetical protein AXF13_08115 [Desulfovibrio fairfieldensis]
MNGLIIDLFAGGGGASTGLAWALGRDPDIAINHDAEALAMHRANHPHTRHMQNDITRVLPLEATGGHPVAILHASPDCTHFSKAKGGKPKSQYIRDLAWVVIRWAEDTHPNLITLENVEEFLTWGPLDKNGQPIKEQAGATFAAWRKRLVRLGYRVEWRLLRACDYGAPTTRLRLFVVARRDKRPIVWPAPTHGNPKSAEVRAGKLLPWRTAAECIDWSIPSRSIFDRKKPLALATQRRIAEGLRRYVLQAAEPFIVTYYGAKGERDFRGQDLGRPLPTQTTENRFGLISPVVVTNTTGHAPTPVDMPMPTLTTGNQQMMAGVVVAPILSRQFGQSIGQSVDAPHPTITQCNHDALVQAVCLAKHYGGVVGHGIQQPLGTVTSIDHHSLVSACLTKYYGKSECAAVDAPLHTLTSKEHMALTSACLVKYYGTAKAADVGEPMHTITAKARMGLVEAEARQNSEPRRYEQVRDFLRTWGVIGPKDEAEFIYQGVVHRITDILMRMLAPRELYTAQGFPPDYIIDRLPDGKCLTKTAQIRMCGNSVPPELVEALVRANGPDTWIQRERPAYPLLKACFAGLQSHPQTVEMTCTT